MLLCHGGPAIEIDLRIGLNTFIVVTTYVSHIIKLYLMVTLLYTQSDHIQFTHSL